MAILFVSLLVQGGQGPTCDPLVTSSCMLPFPSDYWLQSNACQQGEHCATWMSPAVCLTASGARGVTCAPAVNLTKALPVDNLGHGIDAGGGGWDTLDGFSPSSFLSAHFPDDLLADTERSINRNSPRFWNIERSLSDTSSTVLIEAETGDRVAHWVELDHSFGGKHPRNRALLIWPAKRLKSGTRYIVAIRNLHNAAGKPASPSLYFQQLRDGQSRAGWRVQAFHDIFARLENAGVARDGTLQLAWDFTTATRPNLTGRLLAARDDALRREPAGPAYSVTAVTDNYNAQIARRIEGVMKVPLYLNQRNPGQNSRLVLGPDGLPVYQNTTMDATFEILIPHSVVCDRAAPGCKKARVLQYGHGLFGDKNEVQTAYLSEDADRYGYILAATDWIGLAALDEPFVALMMATNLTDFGMVPDRCTQGVVNALMLMRLLKGPAGRLLHDKRFTEVGGVAVNVDGEDRSYFGNSQGGIIGTLYMSVTTDVERGLIGVGGGPYSLLLPRSKDFEQLGTILQLRFPDPLQITSLLSAFQLLWDRAEPMGFADGLTANTLPNTPSHRVVFHYGLGDAQVSWLGCQTLARTTGAGSTISMFESNAREGNESFWGYTTVADTASITEGNAIVGFDFGAATAPFINTPANKSTDAHEKPRRDRHAQDMMDHFFRTGEVINTCGGVCRNTTTTAEP